MADDRIRLNLCLPPHLAEAIQWLVQTGHWPSRTALVRDALVLLLSSAPLPREMLARVQTTDPHPRYWHRHAVVPPHQMPPAAPPAPDNQENDHAR
jgi:Arc/MetJ-type ribon-helix-helix transcriptional regulator